MMARILSCSTVLTPMLCNASLVPQSGQISVYPSSRDVAGGAVYMPLHLGQVAALLVVPFMI